MQTLEPKKFEKAKEQIMQSIDLLEKIGKSEVTRSKKTLGYLSMSMIHLQELKAETYVQLAEEDPDKIV